MKPNLCFWLIWAQILVIFWAILYLPKYSLKTEKFPLPRIFAYRALFLKINWNWCKSLHHHFWMSVLMILVPLFIAVYPNLNLTSSHSPASRIWSEIFTINHRLMVRIKSFINKFHWNEPWKFNFIHLRIQNEDSTKKVVALRPDDLYNSTVLFEIRARIPLFRGFKCVERSTNSIRRRLSREKHSRIII